MSEPRPLQSFIFLTTSRDGGGKNTMGQSGKPAMANCIHNELGFYDQVDLELMISGFYDLWF
jgi:hypothetical protein